MELEGKHVVIVGAGSGIGPALAVASAARGGGAGMTMRRSRAQARLTARWYVLLVGLAACVAAPAAVTERKPVPETPQAALVGTWTLVAADDLHPDGKRTPAYGDHPRGLLMIDGDGRYSLQIFRSERPAFAAGVKTRGTPDEYQAAVLGMSLHVGHCAIDPVHHTLDFQIELASYPNWDATTQKRQYTLAGDELSYQVPASAANSGAIPISVWRRVK